MIFFRREAAPVQEGDHKLDMEVRIPGSECDRHTYQPNSGSVRFGLFRKIIYVTLKLHINQLPFQRTEAEATAATTEFACCSYAELCCTWCEFVCPLCSPALPASVTNKPKKSMQLDRGKKLYQDIPNLYLFINQNKKQRNKSKQMHILTTIIHFSVLAERGSGLSVITHFPSPTVGWFVAPSLMSLPNPDFTTTVTPFWDGSGSKWGNFLLPLLLLLLLLWWVDRFLSLLLDLYAFLCCLYVPAQWCDSQNWIRFGAIIYDIRLEWVFFFVFVSPSVPYW